MIVSSCSLSWKILNSNVNILTVFYFSTCFHRSFFFGQVCYLMPIDPIHFRRQEKSVMKLLVDAETDKVIGASMCGPDSPEIMQVLFSTIFGVVVG